MATFNLYNEAFSFLENEGYEVYPPSTKEGKCEHDYIVLKDDQTAPHSNFSTEVEYYTILCYSPLYTSCMRLKDNVKFSMNKFAPSLMPTGIETPAYFDKEINAYMISVQYRAYRRNKLVKQSNISFSF